jgi:type I restriction enzyme, S subunit
MSLLDAQLGGDRTWTRVGDGYEVTKKPRSLDRTTFPAVPFAAMEAIPQDGTYLPEFTMKAPDAIVSGTYFERGDVLVGKITPSFENGKQALVQDLATPFGYATTEVIPLHPRSGQHDPRLLFFYLLHPDVRHYVAERMEGSTGRQRVPENVLLDLPIPTIDPDDQNAISDTLEIVQRASALEAVSEQTARSLKRASMHELFTRGLHGESQKETEIGLIPESWELASLASLASIERGRFLHRPRNEPRFYGGSTPFVQTGDVVRSAGRIREFSQSLNDEGVAISRVFPAGTILITIAANIGYTGILQFASACPDSLVGITPNARIENAFLEYFLQTQQAEMDRRAPKGTQKNINIQFLNPWPVPVPKIKEQQEIVEILDAVDRKIGLHQRKRTVLDQLFKALLHKLMTGEIRVADLDLSALGKASLEGVAA